jgi:CspA family cold shock protein
MSKKFGTVKWFNTVKGYGFILNEDGEDVFCHYRSIMMEGFKNLSDGQQVTFLQTRSEKGWRVPFLDETTG